MKLRFLALLCCALFSLHSPSFAFAPQAKDVATLKAELKKTGDDSDPTLVLELAAIRTREALDAMLDLYKTTFGSIYMRREVLKGLGGFDGVADSQELALQTLSDAATAEPDVELRMIAIDVLGECRQGGKAVLKRIVGSNADGQVRERAMVKIVGMSSADDKPFFEQLFNALNDDDKSKEKEKKGAKKDIAGEKKAHILKGIRELAFVQIVQDDKAFPPSKLKELAKERDDTGYTTDWERAAGIRRLALLELERRKDAGAVESAREMFKTTIERGVNRAEAARILAEKEGAAMLPLFLETGRADGIGDELRTTLADLTAKMRDESTTKELVKLVGKGDESKQEFVLRALSGYGEPAFVKAVSKQLTADAKKVLSKPVEAKDDSKRALAIQMVSSLVDSGDPAVLKDLQALLDVAKDAVFLGAVLDGVGRLRKNDAEWAKSLETYATDKRVELRNAALVQLAKAKDPKHLPIFVAALENPEWSTRLKALEALVELRSQEATAPIVARIDKEFGWTLNRFADALWKLTGKPFRTGAAAWQGWWAKEGGTFKPISLSELAKLESEEEMRRLKQTSRASFFGIRIVSHRVVFIIDVSGSMSWELHSEKDAKPEESRITIAKTELKKCIESLDAASLFNIITFQSDVSSWLDRVVPASGGAGDKKKGASAGGSSRDEALKFVDAIKAGGGTNIYGAIETAFRDPEVDTIIFLSDGEPSVGLETDQYVIRERVRQWNEHRGVVIHTIAVGGNFKILEWLAQDSGGTHRKIQ